MPSLTVTSNYRNHSSKSTETRVQQLLNVPTMAKKAQWDKAGGKREGRSKGNAKKPDHVIVSPEDPESMPCQGIFNHVTDFALTWAQNLLLPKLIIDETNRHPQRHTQPSNSLPVQVSKVR